MLINDISTTFGGYTKLRFYIFGPGSIKKQDMKYIVFTGTLLNFFYKKGAKNEFKVNNW